jgi:hypothetical protein
VLETFSNDPATIDAGFASEIIFEMKAIDFQFSQDKSGFDQ